MLQRTKKERVRFLCNRVFPFGKTTALPLSYRRLLAEQDSNLQPTVYDNRHASTRYNDSSGLGFACARWFVFDRPPCSDDKAYSRPGAGAFTARFFHTCESRDRQNFKDQKKARASCCRSRDITKITLDIRPEILWVLLLLPWLFQRTKRRDSNPSFTTKWVQGMGVETIV
jgi:hypothetical protein